jgi:quercetin dioxygenase-like cupin family protein
MQPTLSTTEPYTLSEIETFDIVPGYRSRLIHTDSMTLAYVEVTAGAVVPEHAHVHEQVLNVLEGNFELTLDGRPMALEAGQVVVIPSNVPHSGRAITPCRILDVFHPVREDFKNKNVAYANR